MMTLEFKWTVSRARDTAGYNICTLYVDGRKVAACNGGGYDMQGTSLGDWVAKAYADRLLALKPEDMEEQGYYDAEKKARVSTGRSFYGLTFHDPSFDPGKAVIGKDCSDRTLGARSPGQLAYAEEKTVADAEAAGESLGLERYQAFYSASSKVPTERHVIPLIDGGCGFSSVERIMKAIGLSLRYVPVRSKKLTIYELIDAYESGDDVELSPEARRKIAVDRMLDDKSAMKREGK